MTFPPLSTALFHITVYPPTRDNRRHPPFSRSVSSRPAVTSLLYVYPEGQSPFYRIRGRSTQQSAPQHAGPWGRGNGGRRLGSGRCSGDGDGDVQATEVNQPASLTIDPTDRVIYVADRKE